MFDLIVTGGGFEGCLTALEAARRGASVLLAEPRGYLCHEVTAKLRPWLIAKGFKDLEPEITENLFSRQTPRQSFAVQWNITRLIIVRVIQIIFPVHMIHKMHNARTTKQLLIK